MPKLYFKQVISATISLSIVINMIMPACANGLLQTNTNKFQPNVLTAPATSNTGKITSMKAAESKINNFLTPKKKPFELSAIKKTSANNAETLAKDDAGSCGDGVYYEFTADAGILNIYGSGVMDNYSPSTAPPWNTYKDSIKTVIIHDGIDSIGAYAFFFHSKLTKINIPNGVTFIGNEAFNGCSSLPDVIIPDSITFIGEAAFCQCPSLTTINISDNVFFIGMYAFYFCTGLTSVIIGNKVTSIGNFAFEGCTELTSIKIPSSVTFLGAGVFINCAGLASIFVETNNKSYQSIDGILYSKDGNTLLLCPAKKLTNYDVLLNNVTSIGDYAFSSCLNLTQIFIPNHINFIGKGAFSDCTELTSITVASENQNYKSINGSLYSKDGKTLVVCPAKVDVYDKILNNVTFIGDYAFSNCIEVNRLNIPNSIISIGNFAFYACINLNQITIPNSVIFIGDYAFLECTKLLSLTLPKHVTSIGIYTFYDCDSLTQVIIPSSITSIGEYAFSGCPCLSSMNLPSSLTEVGVGVFFDCPNLTSVTLNNAYATKNFKTIFPNYKNFEQIVLGDNVHSIDDSVFAGCTSLKNVTVSGNLDHIGKGAFSNCINLDNFVYKGTKAPTYDTGALVFENCPKLGKITVPDSYEGDDFCGKAITKKEPKPTAKEWFTENVAWLAPAFTILTATVGLFLKYDDVKNFCLSHCPCCNKECETTEISTLDETLV